MKHIGCFSGGKDSTALMLWMREHIGVPGVDWTPVFCDTGWEHPITYAYIEEIAAQLLGSSLLTVRSKKYVDFMDCSLDHHMFPNSQARFCTEDLKIECLHDFFETLDDEITSYQGVRADESAARAAYQETQWMDNGGGYLVSRPLLRWSASDVFAYLKAHDVEPNPLYKMGLSRVGCFPCIHANLRDMRAYLIATPEIKARLVDAETRMCERTGKTDRTFFRHGFIPDRFCSLAKKGANGKLIGIPTAEDVFRYIESVDENQLPLLPARSCMSVYNLCE